MTRHSTDSRDMNMRLTRPAGVLVTLVAAMLAACGGGDDSAPADNDTSNAQGYAADGSTMPLTSTTALDEGTAALEAGLAATATASGSADDVERRQALAASPAAGGLSVSAACSGGGQVTWTVSGGTVAQQVNGHLDAGERYEISFSACQVSGSGATLDGQLSLSVTARTDTSSDLSLAATALKVSVAQGSFQLDGSVRAQRAAANVTGGGTQMSSLYTASALGLGSTVAGRQGSYQLRNLNWTVVRTTNASGVLQGRSHQGTLELAASTTRRPSATLAIATVGSVTLGADAAAAAGDFSISTAIDKLAVSYANGSVTISLDKGNNGTIDKTWTLARGSFLSDAG